MKESRKKKLKIALLLLLSLAVVLFVVYWIVNMAPSEDLPLEKRATTILAEGGCLHCHSANPDLPFYADMPIIGDMIAQDVADGYRAFDIEPMLKALEAGEQPNPVDVAKVESVARQQRMPEAKYYLIHWGTQMTDAKRDIILEWAAKYREAYYNDGLTAERAGEPIRPIPLPENIDEQKAALGFALFHDARLSVDNTVSCASCHGLNTAGVDNKQFSEGVEGKLGGVNAPTVYNAVFNFVQFWDGRATTLAEQAAGPPLNPVEMASESFDEIVAKLQVDEEFAKAFVAVYPEGINQATITDAIEQFERKLVTPNSAFDKWLRGDDKALTAQELNGYKLFKEYNCATCHVGVNLGGESYELMGLRRHYFADRGTELTEEDNGRFKQTQQERDRHRFKVPGLRNVELTWPYYHDGTRATLEDAVRDMGRYQSDVDMTTKEIDDVVAFLRTLTGEIDGKKLTNENSL